MYAIKTPDGLGIYRVINEPLPNGSTDYAAFNVWPAVEVVPQYNPATHGVSAGPWELVNGVATRTYTAAPLPVPEVISLAQFREALIRNGIKPGSKDWEPEVGSLLAVIAAAIGDEVERDAALNKVLFANTIERSHPMFNAFAPLMQKDAAWVDNLFRLGATL